MRRIATVVGRSVATISRWLARLWHVQPFSAAANWGRATIGTVPFVLVGAFYWGAYGVLAGQLIGNAVVSVVVFVLCLIFVRYQIKELRSQI